MKPKKLVPGVYAVGAKDPKRRIFDALIPLPRGTSYNSYLIKAQKTALIDTVNPGFENILEQNINSVVNLADIDYIIMNHAEPDHAGALPFVLSKNKKAVVYCTAKGSELAQKFHGVPLERIKIVKEGDTVDLGGKTLKFIDAPWLHWPETMFTYLVEDKILFPCDFFGAHTAEGFSEDDVPEIISYAKEYFGEIMMPFSIMGKKAIEKLANYEIRMIAPSHGPIYKNPALILDKYKDWTAGKTSKKAIIVYVSMWKYTSSMLKIVEDTLKKEGVEVVSYDLAVGDMGKLAADLVDSRAIVVGSPTLLGGIHPLVTYAASIVKALKPPIKYAAVLGSYGWSGSAVRQTADFFQGTKIEAVGTFESSGLLSEEDKVKINSLGKLLAEKINKSE